MKSPIDWERSGAITFDFYGALMESPADWER
jgi:hypothetical protein